MKYQNIASFFEEKSPKDIEQFIDKNLDISQQVYSILKEKKWTQKDFAKKLNKSDAEISKWLSGSHNLTLRSIAKMEAVLGTDIILTPNKAISKYKQVEYIKLKVFANPNRMTFESEPNSFEKVIAENKKGEKFHKALAA